MTTADTVRDREQTPPASTPRSSSDERRATAWIGQGVIIEGTITSAQDLRIDGKVDGEIKVGDHGLIIGAGAAITANLVGRSIVISGTVNGKRHRHGEDRPAPDRFRVRVMSARRAWWLPGGRHHRQGRRRQQPSAKSAGRLRSAPGGTSAGFFRLTARPAPAYRAPELHGVLGGTRPFMRGSRPPGRSDWMDARLRQRSARYVSRLQTEHALDRREGVDLVNSRRLALFRVREQLLEILLVAEASTHANRLELLLRCPGSCARSSPFQCEAATVVEFSSNGLRRR